MAAQSSKSSILAQMKNKSKGGWAGARKASTDAKPRSGQALPPNLKNAVCCLVNYKLAKASNGNPYFGLTGIIKEPDDLNGRRVTFMWFMAESDYNTYEEAELALANDIALITGEQAPEDYDGILEVFKDLCERGVHVLFNTGRERKGGKAPNPYVQGPAEGWEDNPQEGAGEAEDKPQRGRAGATAGTNGDEAPPDEPQEVEPEPEAEAEGGEEAVYIPQKGDEYQYTPKNGKEETYVVLKTNEEKETVDLKQKKAVKGKAALQFKNVPFSKLSST